MSARESLRQALASVALETRAPGTGELAGTEVEPLHASSREAIDTFLDALEEYIDERVSEALAADRPDGA